jgi:hypothetical protein
VPSVIDFACLNNQKFFASFFKKEVLSFCSFLKKRTKKLFQICTELYPAT